MSKSRKPEEEEENDAFTSPSREKILLRKLLLFSKDVATVRELGMPLHRFLFEDNNGEDGTYFENELKILKSRGASIREKMYRFIARQAQWRILNSNVEYTSSLYYTCRKFEENLRPTILFDEELFEPREKQQQVQESRKIYEIGQKDLHDGEMGFIK